MPSRREVLKGGGAVVVGGLSGGLLASPAAASARARRSAVDESATSTVRAGAVGAQRFRRGAPGPLYWSTYGYSNSLNSQIPEAVWKANIDWVAEELAPYGYTMVCTDGWIDNTQGVTAHGYIRSLSDDWKHDWAWWSRYLQRRGMQLGVYYNPLWVTKSAVSDPSVRVVGRPDVAVADLVDSGDDFDGGGQLQWVDVTRDGAEEYVKGYVEYFRALGAVFLRIDFLGWYEIGYDQAEGTIGIGHGRENYVQALEWMHEAADGEIQLSLVMPNLFDHGAAERQYGDLIRIDNDVGLGTWYSLSEGRQTWQPIWSQWNNPFQGFTGFSDISGPGQLVLDGDPLIMSSFDGDAERQSAISLFVMAGAAIAVADQYDTIGPHATSLQNRELLELRQSGLVGKPVYLNSHAYDYDQTSRDPERWIAQLADSSWVVGLFNRTNGPAPATRSLDFGATLGLTQPALVHDLWAHEDLGTFQQWSVTLAPHASSLVRVVPQEAAYHLAEVGAFAGTARFANDHGGYTGLGYVTGLDTPGSSVTLAMAAPSAGSHRLDCRVANATTRTASLSVTVRDPQTGRVRGSDNLTVGSTSEWTTWQDVAVTLPFAAGTNLVELAFAAHDTGSVDVDRLSLTA